jgi:6-phosphogluconolactonase
MGVHELLEFPAADQLVAALAKRVGVLLTEGVAERGQATLAVSGGSTPIPLFARLAEMELPWEKVTVALVDERWVDTGSPDSNENQVRRHLLQKKAAAARFVGMKNEAATPLAGEVDCAARLQTLSLPWDCLILGMGNDGHTASLFPNAANLAAATDPHSGRICMTIHPPAAPHERMTLTLPAILNSRQLILHLQGEEKKKVLARAQEEGAAEAMPIRYILRQQTTSLAVYWSP